MASRETITPNIPDTLPEDFSDWDNASASKPVSAPAKMIPAEAARPKESRIAAPQRAASHDSRAQRPVPPPIVLATRVAALDPPRIAVETQRKPVAQARPLNIAEKRDAAARSMPRPSEARPASVPQPVLNQDEDVVRPERRFNLKMAIAGGVAVVVCAGIGVVYMVHGSRSHSQMQPGASGAVQTSAMSVPSNNLPSASNAGTARNNDAGIVPKPSAATPLQDASPAAASQPDNQTATDKTPQQPAVASTANMAQFTAASRIQRGQLRADNSPEPAGNLNAANMAAENAGSSNSLFSSQGKNHVQLVPTAPISVSASALQGLLIKKTLPAYPQIAKAARVSGTVTVVATISPQGTVTEARAVSGPVVLRQAATEAVKSWRYKPYILGNQPVAVVTNINIDFALN